MNKNVNHIVGYRTLIIVLLGLLLLTVLTVAATTFELQSWNVAIALLIAGAKAFLIMTFFMHLKYEITLLRVFVGVVFLLYLVILLITLLDYLTR